MPKQPAPEQLDPNDTALAPLTRPSSEGQLNHVNANPYVHVIEGVRNLVSTNLIATLLMALTSIVASYVLTHPLRDPVSNVYASTFGGSLSGSLIRESLAALLIFVVINVILQALLGQAQTRLVVTGVRKQRETYVGALRLAASRLVITILSYLAIFGLALLVVGATALLTLALPVLAPLFILAAFIVITIIALNLIYVTYVLADDVRDIRVLDVLRTSSRLWKVSRRAVLSLFLALVGIAFVVSIAFASIALQSRTHAMYGVQSHAQMVESLRQSINPPLNTGTIFNAFLGACIGLILTSGLANIYNKAKALL